MRTQPLVAPQLSELSSYLILSLQQLHDCQEGLYAFLQLCWNDLGRVNVRLRVQRRLGFFDTCAWPVLGLKTRNMCPAP